MRTILAGFALLCWGSAATAGCVGENLIDRLPADQRAEIAAAVAGVPHHRGLLWRATKGDQHMTLVGTYHFGDPRHDPMLARLDPLIADAGAVFVEAGPEEEARLTEAESSARSSSEQTKRAVTEAEREIERHESRKAELEALMADPDLYGDQERWSAVSKEYNQVERHLERAYQHWEEAQQAIEAIEQEVAGTGD